MIASDRTPVYAASEMKNQLRIKLALRKETVRALHQVELADVVGGLTAPQTVACPSVRVKCNTTPAP